MPRCCVGTLCLYPTLSTDRHKCNKCKKPVHTLCATEDSTNKGTNENDICILWKTRSRPRCTSPRKHLQPPPSHLRLSIIHHQLHQNRVQLQRKSPPPKKNSASQKKASPTKKAPTDKKKKAPPKKAPPKKAAKKGDAKFRLERNKALEDPLLSKEVAFDLHCQQRADFVDCIRSNRHGAFH